MQNAVLSALRSTLIMPSISPTVVPPSHTHEVTLVCKQCHKNHQRYHYQSKICGTPGPPLNCLTPQVRRRSGECRIFCWKENETK